MKPTSQTNWARLTNDDDQDIDYTDIPPLDAAFFARARLEWPNAVQVDADVLAWFKQQGQNYTDRINQILRDYMATHDRAA